MVSTWTFGKRKSEGAETIFLYKYLIVENRKWFKPLHRKPTEVYLHLINTVEDETCDKCGYNATLKTNALDIYNQLVFNSN